MDNFWWVEDLSGLEPEEVVLTYRPAAPEPVVLRYERELPECMGREPEKADGPARPGLGPLDPPERPRKRWGVRLYVGISLLLIVVCLGVGIWYVGEYGWALPSAQGPREYPYEWDEPRPWEGDGGYYWDAPEPEDAEITIPGYPTGGDVRLSLSGAEGLPELTIQEIYESVNPAVATVLGRQDQEMSVSVGTGVVFSPDGYILTNCHVISGCSQCEVWITDGYGVDRTYPAKVVGYDADADLAVLKIEAPEELYSARFGISDDLRVGDTVYAIGNPLGLELRDTLTDGIVSATTRDVDVNGVTMTLLQTTAALNSGNSGGPLINQYGQVIGINTIKMMSQYNTIEGLGFAIPSSVARRQVNELIEFGEIQPQPVLGVTVNRIPQTLPDGRLGLRLEEVTPGLSGDRAGLRNGDYLVSFAGQELSSFQQLINIRRDLSVGDEVPLQVYRDGEYLDKVMIMMSE